MPAPFTRHLNGEQVTFGWRLDWSEYICDMSVFLTLLGLLPETVLEGLLGGAGRSAGTNKDARTFADEGRVRCAVRAVEGRVLNMGTEWSFGTAHVTAGHLTFEPSMGIVGSRQIAVQRISLGTTAPMNPTDYSPFDGTEVVIVTAKGELRVGFPSALFNDVVAVLGTEITAT